MLYLKSFGFETTTDNNHMKEFGEVYRTSHGFQIEEK